MIILECDVSKFKSMRLFTLISLISIFLLSFSLLGSSLAFSVSNQIFSSPVNLSNDTGTAQFPDVVNVGNNVYVAWTQGSGGILFRASTNGGSSWSPPLSQGAMRISHEGGTTQYPLMSANGSYVYVTWSQTVGSSGLQLFEATSTNFGVSFAVRQVTSGVSSNGWITPVIASWGSNVYIVYSGDGKNSYVISSNNAGATWTTPFHYGVTFEPEAAVVGSNVYAVADGIQFAVSHNAGATWTKVLNEREEGDEPMIAASGNDVYIVAQCRCSTGPIWLLTSTNSGNSFIRTDINGKVTNNWQPMVGAYGSSAWVDWHNNPGGKAAQEWMTMTANSGATWTAPVSISGTGHWVGWPWEVSTTDGRDIYTMWPQQVTSSPNYWVDRASYSSNGGSTWSSPPGIDVSQNTNGQAAPENDIANGAISSYGSTAFAVWQFTSTSGTNQIYFASS